LSPLVLAITAGPEFPNLVPDRPPARAIGAPWLLSTRLVALRPVQSHVLTLFSKNMQAISAAKPTARLTSVRRIGSIAFVY
jgi:hypothetical protein